MSVLKGFVAWNTDSEIKYIDTIGSGIKNTSHTQEQVLTGYIESIPHRADWKGMNREQVEQAARAKLLALRAIGHGQG